MTCENQTLRRSITALPLTLGETPKLKNRLDAELPGGGRMTVFHQYVPGTGPVIHVILRRPEDSVPCSTEYEDLVTCLSHELGTPRTEAGRDGARHNVWRTGERGYPPQNPTSEELAEDIMSILARNRVPAGNDWYIFDFVAALHLYGNAPCAMDGIRATCLSRAPNENIRQAIRDVEAAYRRRYPLPMPA